MRRHLTAAILSSTALVVLAASVPAHAGGWDSLRFRRDHYLVGQIARARTEFFAGDLEGAGPLDGRVYSAYLLPRSRDIGFGMITPPTIPTGAIRLGALDVEGPFEKPDGYPYGIASLTFSVPDVPTGSYSIGFCDDPCTYGTVGWLAWGYLTIVHTPLEGRLLRREAGLEARVDALERTLRLAERDSAAVVAELTGSLRTARTALRVASSAPSIDRAEATRPAPVPAAEPSLPWWASFGVGAAGASLLSWAGHRRRHRTRSIPRAVTETGASDPAAEREPIGV